MFNISEMPLEKSKKEFAHTVKNSDRFSRQSLPESVEKERGGYRSQGEVQVFWEQIDGPSCP